MRYAEIAKKSHVNALRHCGHNAILFGYGATQ